MDEKEKLEQAIAAQESLRGTVPDEIIDAGIASIREKLAAISVESGAVASGDSAKAMGQDAFDASGAKIKKSLVAGRDMNLYIKLETADAAAAFWNQWQKPDPDLQKATERYLAYLAGRYLYLDFKGMGVTDQVPLRLPLAEMYVGLKARIEMPKGETWARELKLAGRRASDEEIAAMGQRLSEPQPVLKLVQKQDGLIILGDPGAGKTTFLKYLALQLALGVDIGLGARLPVLLPLAAYANALAERDIALHKFIAEYYEGLGIDEPLSTMLAEALDRGGVLLLLDGLDEVQRVGQRNLVIDRVLDFFAYRSKQGNKFILSSRIVGYRDVRPSSTDMAECTLVDFGEDEIGEFIDKWTKAIERQAQGSDEVAQLAAAQEKAALLEAVEHNPGVRRLAANPLLLTILALMKRQGVLLPDRRVELYDRYVTALLKHWNVARGLGRPPTRDLDVVETVRVLAPLALWIHETNPGVGLVKREDVKRKLIEIYTERGIDNPEQAARQLLSDARQYANLLLERGAGQYGFIHLTFQEYLAAVAIAQQGQEGIAPIVETLSDHIDDDTWREVTLLTIGHIGLIQQLDKRAGAVLEQLVADAPGEAGMAVLLAGEAVADVGSAGVTAQCRQVVTQALLATLSDDQRIPLAQRIEAGRTLARVGDPRPEVMTVAGMKFGLIPKGEFWMGSGDDDPQADSDEKPLHKVKIDYDYWLGQFPVTNAQFEEFVVAGGYQEASFWREAANDGWWQGGKVKDWNTNEWRERPYNYGRLFTVVNQPVVGVTWYESLAFCRWLTTQLPDGYEAILPSEAEWEKGARGGLVIPETAVIVALEKLGEAKIVTQANLQPQRLFPWETEFDDNRVNYNKVGKAPNTLDCFFSGRSPYGLQDMAGNVWEWQRTVWGHEYPYVAGDGREALDVGDNKGRLLRGGSWLHDSKVLRCACRNDVPDYHIVSLGFRVCVRPHFPS